MSHLLAALAGVVALLQAYRAFDGGAGAPLLAPTLAALLASCLLGHALWRRFPHVLESPLRELLGVLWLCAGLTGVLVWNKQNSLAELRGWEYGLLVVAPLGLLLHSQASFVAYLTVHAAVLLLALALAPSGLAALAFFGLALLCCASLAQREATDRFPHAAGGVGSLTWLRGAWPWGLALVALYLAFSATKPPAETTTAKDWVQWLQGRRPSRPGVQIDGEGGVTGGGTGAPGAGGTGAPGAGQGRDPTPGARRVTQGSAPTKGPPRVGFNEDLKFGDLSDEDERVAFYARVRTTTGAAPDPLAFRPYWAAGALSSYEGGEWRGDEATRELSGPIQLSTGIPGVDYEQEVILWQRSSGKALFALYPIQRLDLPRALLDGEGRLRQAGGGLRRYTLRSRVCQPEDFALRRDAPRAPHGRYLGLDMTFVDSPRFQRLAARLRAMGRTPQARIEATLRHLSGYAYTLRPGLDPAADPTLAFLERGRGYCQHFASAMVVLLRAQGIPARIGVGYAGGEWQREGGYYLVRQRHAHAWVEVPYARHGWVVYDPASVALQRGDPRAERPPPRETPSASPSVTPTTSPSVGPSESPLESPSVGPSESPVETPSVSPSVTPTTSPRVSPSEPPVETPSVSPSASPVESPSVTPSASPSPSPLDDTSPSPTTVASPRRGRVTAFDRLWDMAGLGEGASPSGSPSPSASPSPGASPSVGPAGPVDRPVDRGGDPTQGPGPGPRAVTDPRHEAAASARFVASALLRDLGLLGLGALVLIGLVIVWRGWRQQRRQAAAAAEGEEPALAWGADAAASPAAEEGLRASRELVRLYLDALAALARRGQPRDPAETPAEFAERLAARAGLTELTALFVRARYGREATSAADLERARRLAEELGRG
ncbi:MAG: transglutaminase domain-containing protein [Planctomycetota bacterium]